MAAVSCARSVRGSRSKEFPMPTRVAINGFGRIGRAVMRAAAERGADLEIVAVNDITDPQTMAQLRARDSVYGRFPEAVRAENGTLLVGERSIRALHEPDPTALPWADLGIEV